MKLRLAFAVCTICASLIFAEDVLVFCGGRPWGASHLTKALVSSRASVKVVGPMDLAGLNGVSLKKFPTDPKEPETKDGITPEFKQLSKYKVVFFTAIPRDCMEKLLTPERIKALREYVEQGGAVLWTNDAPDCAAELLPVKLGESVSSKGVVVQRPALPSFTLLPESWNKYTPMRQATPMDGAIVHCMLKSAEGNQVGIAYKELGKGRVWYFNGDWKVNASDITSFNHWAYNGVFINGLLAEAGGVKMDMNNCMPHFQTPPEKKELSEVTYSFKEQSTAFVTSGTAIMNENKVELSNGLCIQLKNGGDIAVRYPGVTRPAGHNLPLLQFSGKPQALNGDNNEAIVKKYNLKNVAIDWKRTSAVIEGNRLVMVYDDGQGAKMRWEFMPCELTLDGRKYIGYGERIVMETLPMRLESVVLSSRVPRGKIRRMTCYTNPRGYLEGEISADGIKDSSIWQFFCSGQPFTYLATPNGIMVDIVDAPVPLYAQYRARKAGDDMCSRTLRLLAGYRKCPVELSIIWHLFSPGTENGNNDYVAMYQYARKHLRDKCGIKEFPQATEACFYLHKRSPQEIEAAAASAQKLNFKSVWLSYCPLPMDQVDGEKLKDTMQIALKHGLRPHPWTPGVYGHGDKQPIYVQHPDWFIRDRKGNAFKYFKQHTVMDLNNPDFRDWYSKTIERTMKNGMGAIYMDMGGQASGNVNYSLDDTPANIDGLVKIFQDFSKRNLPFSVEGMNPLAKDQALFSPEKSLPVIGREFAYVGACPLVSVDAGVKPLLYIDYFRLGMFNGTTNVNMDGYTLGIERVPGEKKLMEKIGGINLVLNKAHAHVPTPFVRETAFGTAWIGKDTGALFFYHPVKKLNLQLPDGWTIEKGASLVNIPSGSVLLLSKKK